MVTHPDFPGIDFDFVVDTTTDDPELRLAHHTACRDWVMIDAADPAALGFLPLFVLRGDDRPCIDQVNQRYQFGGWRESKGWSYDPRDIEEGGTGGLLCYPEDPPMKPFAMFMHDSGEEMFLAFPHGYCMVLYRGLNEDGTCKFSVARID